MPFNSPMAEADANALRRVLDLDMHLHPKLHASPTSPGVVRLDFHSGLFLEHGGSDGGWVLEGRTWGHPSAAMVRGWHLRALAAARGLAREASGATAGAAAAGPPRTSAVGRLRRRSTRRSG